MPTQTLSRPTRRHSPENAVDANRVIDIATRYPAIEVEALAERFGTTERTIYNVLHGAGIYRSEVRDRKSVRSPVHPWRPAPRRRSPQQIAMSKAERQAMIDAYLAKKTITKVPTGVMATADVTHLDHFHD